MFEQTDFKHVKSNSVFICAPAVNQENLERKLTIWEKADAALKMSTVGIDSSKRDLLAQHYQSNKSIAFLNAFPSKYILKTLPVLLGKDLPIQTQHML
eukprot:1838921-Amphidinium_carterae.1